MPFALQQKMEGQWFLDGGHAVRGREPRGGDRAAFTFRASHETAAADRNHLKLDDRKIEVRKMGADGFPEIFLSPIFLSSP